jgi:prolyl 4-hydroxylase
MQKAALDAGWLAWLREWMYRGGDMAQAVLELRRQGFSDAAIVNALEAVRPKGNALADGAMRSLPLIRRAPSNLRRLDAAGFPLYTLADFLSPTECAELIGMIGGHLQPSPLSRAHEDPEFRSSTTANLYEIDDPRARAVDEKICRTLGIRAEYSEGIQAQRYEAGQQFKPHWDCFEAGTNTYQRFAGVRGNRTWTFMVYLNDGMEGGATRFTEIGQAVQPKAGMALFWDNLHEDGSPNQATKHCGEPVTRGHKVIITKWFRVHGDGPVFHE